MKNQTKKIKKEVKRLVKKDRMGSAFSYLEKFLLKDDDKDLLTNLISQYNGIKKEKKKNLIQSKEYRTEVNGIRASFIDFVTELETSDLNINEHDKETIQETIIVVCKKERKELMSDFFSTYYFKNLTYHTFDKNVSKLKPCDLVIFDVNYLNLEHGEQLPNEEYDLLESFLEKCSSDKSYLLFFSAARMPEKLTERFGKIAYFSNSVFSLYSRIKEMLEFMRLYQGETHYR